MAAHSANARIEAKAPVVGGGVSAGLAPRLAAGIKASVKDDVFNLVDRSGSSSPTLPVSVQSISASRMPTALVDVFGAKDRRDFAFSVVESAIGIYKKGVVADIFHVQTINRWLQWAKLPRPEAARVLPWDERHFAIAQLLYDSAMRVGGISVKAMQFVGLRDDLPMGYREWFSKAQEATAIRSPPSHVEKVLADACKDFQHVSCEKEPVKSASIAQVHFGIWQGRQAVFKVQHPHVRTEYLTDLRIMEDLGRHVDKYDEARGAAVMLRAIADKLRPLVDMETDFSKEAANQQRCRSSFNGDVVVAEVFHASELVLVMERLPGMTAAEVIKCWERGEALDHFGPKQRGAVYDAYATMIFGHRFFQIDAHPGNFLALTDGTGRVALLDFGQCCEPSEASLKRLIDFARAAPGSEKESVDSAKTKAWLGTLGVDVDEARADAAAKLLVYGGQSALFPATENMQPEAVPVILILLYLSRFENTAAQWRKKLGLADEVDHFAVLRAFKKGAGLNPSTACEMVD